ncbi:uncharacterized protein LACBIDRAFT_322551 [Laccaria bicolor S238N-H82]|uniref:Predicted protein n=1 Tax=Laccaria bicolor (strain S238N-H82 / ATCC MYA-4686) TaxID=486041 RepID=B0CWQ0_LACBS|nr:uncharacterized protein LACBIDRAFT_322551 [Laccaria bicolor S238N-H82]EDR13549.1 predicted protein [Laccaria bicolor S238N-H82]|eukprot:XP_001876047.1 predicted protein [Laccaria bicolor S238N-H82]
MGFIFHETIGGTAPPRGAPVKFVFGVGREVKGGRRTRPPETKATIKVKAVVTTTMAWIVRQRGWMRRNDWSNAVSSGLIGRHDLKMCRQPSDHVNAGYVQGFALELDANIYSGSTALPIGPTTKSHHLLDCAFEQFEQKMLTWTYIAFSTPDGNDADNDTEARSSLECARPPPLPLPSSFKTEAMFHPTNVPTYSILRFDKGRNESLHMNCDEAVESLALAWLLRSGWGQAYLCIVFLSYRSQHASLADTSILGGMALPRSACTVRVNIASCNDDQSEDQGGGSQQRPNLSRSWRTTSMLRSCLGPSGIVTKPLNGLATFTPLFASKRAGESKTLMQRLNPDRSQKAGFVLVADLVFVQQSVGGVY